MSSLTDILNKKLIVFGDHLRNNTNCNFNVMVKKYIVHYFNFGLLVRAKLNPLYCNNNNLNYYFKQIADGLTFNKIYRTLCKHIKVHIPCVMLLGI